MMIRFCSWLVILLLLEGLHSSFADSITYAYDEVGRLIGVYYKDGRSLTYVYDPAGNLLRRTAATFTDADADGMDDGWETGHFEANSRDGTADFDSDGSSDLAEFLAGTDPKDAGSVLVVSALASEAGVSFKIEWAAVPGKNYRVQYNETLEPSGWRSLPGDVTAAGSTASKVDGSASEETKRFYRVQVLH